MHASVCQTVQSMVHGNLIWTWADVSCGERRIYTAHLLGQDTVLKPARCLLDVLEPERLSVCLLQGHKGCTATHPEQGTMLPRGVLLPGCRCKEDEVVGQEYGCVLAGWVVPPQHPVDAHQGAENLQPWQGCRRPLLSEARLPYCCCCTVGKIISMARWVAVPASPSTPD